MPCIQCASGKWKWGERGRCIWETKKACQDANEGRRSVTCSCSKSAELETVSVGGADYILHHHADLVHLHEQKKDLPPNAMGWGADYVLKQDEGDEELTAEETDITKRIVPVRATKEVRDRDNDIITVGGSDAKGLDIRFFKQQNPMVLFGHRSREIETVVGRAFKVRKTTEDGARVVSAELGFLGRDLNPLADTVFKLMTMKPRVLNMVSIGFRFLELELDRKLLEEEDLIGFLIKRSELLEISVVPVGSNPGALVQARSVGVDLAPLKTFFEETLDNRRGERYAQWMTVKDLEQCYTVCNSGARTFRVPDGKSADELVADSVATSADQALTKHLLEAEEEGGRIMAKPRFDESGKIVGLDFEAGEVKAPATDGAPASGGAPNAGTSGGAAPANPTGAVGTAEAGSQVFELAGKTYTVPKGYVLSMEGDQITIVPESVLTEPPAAQVKQPPADGDKSNAGVDPNAWTLEFVEEDGSKSDDSKAKSPEDQGMEMLGALVSDLVSEAIDQRTGKVG